MASKKTREQFINELSKIQPNIKLIGDYINSETKTIVEDTLEIKYLVVPYKLLQNREPSILSALDKNEAFILKAKRTHGEKYSYLNSVYLNQIDKITVTCNIHGDFKISPVRLFSGQGCKNCGFTARGLKKRTTNENFKLKAKKIHKGFYSYNLVDYKGDKEKVKIICPKHGVFEQISGTHLQGRGCQKCKIEKISNSAKLNSYGWSFTKWSKKSKNNKANLYIIECYDKNERFLKVGITIYDVKKRYPGKREMPYIFKILKEENGSTKKIYKMEQSIKKTFKNNKYTPSIKFNGMYECYDIKLKKDVLNFIRSFSL